MLHQEQEKLVAPPSTAATEPKKRYKHIPQRWDVDEAWYFVTVVTRDRHPHFLSEKSCQILLNACKSVQEQHPFRLGSLIIMPDHWHALIKPRGKEVIESIVGSLKQRIFHASRKDDKVIHWQQRFMDHRIRSETDYFQHLEYMRLNPCKHELVKCEDEIWPWWFIHPNPFS